MSSEDSYYTMSYMEEERMFGPEKFEDNNIRYKGMPTGIKTRAGEMIKIGDRLENVQGTNSRRTSVMAGKTI